MMDRDDWTFLIVCILIMIAAISVIYYVLNGGDEDITSVRGNQIYTITHDECEYIVLDGYYAGGIIHKENCSNH